MNGGMPTERRDITFSPAELLPAIDAYRLSAPELLPPGQIAGLRAHQDNGGAAMLSVSVRSLAGPVEIRLHTASVLEMLIRFCIESRIPLLRRARKHVTTANGNVTLVLEDDAALAHGAPDTAALRPPRCRAIPCRVECQTDPDACQW